MASFVDWIKSKVGGGTKNGNSNQNSYSGSRTQVPYQNPVSSYTGTGSGVLKPGTILKDNNYSSPNDILGTSTGSGVYYSKTPEMGGAYGGSGGGADPLAELRRSVQDKFNNLQSVFNDIYGQVDNVIREKTGQLNSSYDQNINDVNQGYQRGIGQTSSIYGARGLGDSSYLGDKMGELSSDYQRSINDLTTARGNQLADLGQYAATTKAGLDASRNQYQSAFGQLGNLDAAGLQNFSNNLDSAIAGASQQRAGLGTNSDFINKVNEINPAQQQFTGQLATKLQNLITSSAPTYAKKQVAQGLIKTAALNDPAAQSYWSGYFDDLLRNNGVA